MIKKLLLLTACLLAVNSLFACDVCGCYMGITPNIGKNSFGVYYRYKAYQGYTNVNHKHSLFPNMDANRTGFAQPLHSGHVHSDYDNSDYEVIQVAEIRGKYFIHPNIELNTVLPYYYNNSVEGPVFSEGRGMGDVNFYTGFHIVNTEGKKLMHRVITGFGVKLPTGRTNTADEYGVRNFVTHQPGTGTTDLFAYVNHIMGYNKWVLSTNVMAKANGENEYNERLSGSVSANLSVFYKLEGKQITWMPSIKSGYEYMKGVYINDVLETGTGTNSMVLGPGIDAFVGKLGFSLTTQFAVYDKQPFPVLANSGQIIGSITYNFGTNNFLLKSE